MFVIFLSAQECSWNFAPSSESVSNLVKFHSGGGIICKNSSAYPRISSDFRRIPGILRRIMKVVMKLKLTRFRNILRKFDLAFRGHFERNFKARKRYWIDITISIFADDDRYLFGHRRKRFGNRGYRRDCRLLDLQTTARGTGWHREDRERQDARVCFFQHIHQQSGSTIVKQRLDNC